VTGAGEPWRPTRAQVAAAVGRTVPDVVAPGLRVLFCGINPGLYSGAVGHHFARPGNRFWRALHLSGFTDRVLSPSEERELLTAGLGITNLVGRATAVADHLVDDELRAGGARLARKVRRLRPGTVAFLGIGAYRVAFGRPEAMIGPQPATVGGAGAWVLPNPSGLNAHYQVEDLAEAFRALRASLPASGAAPVAPRAEGPPARPRRGPAARPGARPGRSSPHRGPR
jgi:TDG/mug DNA glycosylase family protein